MQIRDHAAYDEFVEFMLDSPSLEQITQFRLSDAMEQKINDLLDANRNRTLSAEERAELDEYIRLEHLMRKMKIRAFEKLAGK